MNPDHKHLKELYDLLEAMREDVITDEQFNRLESLIASDDHACELYFKYMQFCSDLLYFQHAHTPVNESDLKPITLDVCGDVIPKPAILDYTVWQELAEAEMDAIGIESEIKNSQEQVPVEIIKPAPHQRQVSRFNVYLAALSSAAMVFILLLVWLTPPPGPIVATLIDSIDAELFSEDGLIENGDILRQGPLTLSKGFVEIEFEGGGIVTIEGPAEFALESSGSMYLGKGKLAARVSEYATGFTVRTLSSTVVDLGTEFGLNVSQDGSCELHMFTGKASLVTGKKDDKKTSQLITAQQARFVDGYTGQVSDIKLQEEKFIRVIDSKNKYIWRGQDVDLVDIAVGGDGHGTGNLNKGIYPVSGKLKDVIWEVDGGKSSGFVMVDSLSRVDGVFVPDGETGAVQVTSQGHSFDQFGDTCGMFHKTMFHSDASFNNGMLIRKVIIGGQEIRGSDGPAIVLHANLGITFDLDAIRAALPQLEVDRFEGACGIVDDAVPAAKADFWVLVDGEVRFKSKDAMPGDGSRSISVELDDGDRFLTLVVTDAGGDIAGDWGVFVEPVLELKLSEL